MISRHRDPTAASAGSSARETSTFCAPAACRRAMPAQISAGPAPAA